MDIYDNTSMTFGYSDDNGGYINVRLSGDDATYLPKVLFRFSEFLRAAGFVYVGVELDDAGNIVFTKNHLYQNEEYVVNNAWPTNDPVNAAPTEMDVLKAAEKALYESPEDYWDEVVGNAAADLEYYDWDNGGFNVGDVVQYVRNQPTGDEYDHAGYTGVSLAGKVGRVVKVLGGEDRYLVEFLNWNDGHTGLFSGVQTNQWWADGVNLEYLATDA